MKNFFTGVGNFVAWVLTLACLLITWVCYSVGGNIPAILFGIAAAMLIPMNPFRYIRREWLNIKALKAILLALVLFVAGAFTFPAAQLTSNDTYLTLRGHLETVVDPAVIDEAETYLNPVGLIGLDELTDKLPLPDSGEDPVPNDEGTDVPPADTSAPANPMSFSVTYIDVGQGDAALVECDGAYMLIDGGTSGNSSKIYSILKSRGIKELDIMVASHAHEDHIGGLAGALNYATAKLVLCPTTAYDSESFGDFTKYLGKQGLSITVPKVGDTFALGSAEIEILAVNSGEVENDTSIIMNVTYGDTGFLFTGDAEGEAERAAMRQGRALRATVLKVGHHGAETSTSKAFLRKVDPTYAVISVGEDNSYGHPTRTVLDTLQAADVTLYRTDLQGDITCVSDGKTVSFTTARGSDADAYGAAGVIPTPTPTPSPTPTPIPQNYVTDYVLNTNTKKFHYPYCKSVDKMKESNKDYYTGSREDVIRRGYDPCGNCHP